MMSNINGLLIDISGTLIVDGVISPTNINWISNVIKKEIPFLMITNTTISSRQEIVSQINGFGLNINLDHILNPETAAFNYIEEKYPHSSLRILMNHTEHNWNKFKLDNNHPDFIVLGDLQHQFDYAFLNEIFNQILSGSRLIALHKSKFWSDMGKLKIDLGGYVSLLDYASGQEAIVIGKPSSAYFETACSMLGLRPESVLMVGDDIYSDGLAAQAACLNSALVKTGKYLKKFEHIAIEHNILVVDELSDINLNKNFTGV